MKNKLSTLCLTLYLAVPAASVALLCGCAGTPTERSTGEYIDDKSLNHRVKSALNNNEEYKFSDLNVTSFKGTVQLSGFVNTSDQKRKAAEIAQSVDGVKAVENNVSIKNN